MSDVRISKINGKAVPPPVPGERRLWERCKRCGWTGYRDYIPYGLGGMMHVMGCGHDVVDRSASERITEAEAVSAINAFRAKTA